MSENAKETWQEACLQTAMRVHNPVDHVERLTLFERVAEIANRMNVSPPLSKALLRAANREVA